MKRYRNIALSCLALIALQACKDETITTNRGKVKFETIAVSAKVPGRIEKIYVEEGQTVQTGDTLALLNIPEVHAKMMQVEGAISGARAA